MKLKAVVISLLLLCATFACTQTLSTFEGIDSPNSESIAVEPDMTVAVGPSQVLQVVNACMQFTNKITHAVVGPACPSGMASVAYPWYQNSYNGGATPNCGAAPTSPNLQVFFDRITQRFILVRRKVFPATGLNYQCIAISSSADANDVGFSWFGSEQLVTNVPTDQHGNPLELDYPQAAPWPTTDDTASVWVIYDVINASTGFLVGTHMCVTDYAGLLSSTASPYVNNVKPIGCKNYVSVINPSAPVARHSLEPALVEGPNGPYNNRDEVFMGEVNPISPSLHTGYFFALFGHVHWNIVHFPVVFTLTSVPLVAVTDSNTPAFIPGCYNPVVTVDTFCIAQPGTTVPIDSVGDRLGFTLKYRNFGTFESYVVASTYQINNTLTAHCSGANCQTGIQVTEFRSTGAGLGVGLPTFQQRIKLTPSTSTEYQFLPSVFQDSNQNAELVYAYTDPTNTIYPSIGITYVNLATPVLPVTDRVMWQGYFSSTDPGAGGGRWGDYLYIGEDSSWDCNAFAVGEYLPSTRSSGQLWNTRIGELGPISFPCP